MRYNDIEKHLRAVGLSLCPENSDYHIDHIDDVEIIRSYRFECMRIPYSNIHNKYVCFEDVTVCVYNHGGYEVESWEITFPRLGFDAQSEIKKYEEILENKLHSFLENQGDFP
jgi:hypothetical protein